MSNMMDLAHQVEPGATTPPRTYKSCKRYLVPSAFTINHNYRGVFSGVSQYESRSCILSFSG